MLLTKMLQLLINVFCPLAAGYALKRSGKMGPDANRALMLVNVYVVLTVMNLLSFWILPLNSSLLTIPLLSILGALISGGLGYFTFGRVFDNSMDRGSYTIAAMLSNIGTMAGLAGYIVYGEVSYAYTQLYAMSQNIMMALCVFPLAQYFRSQYLQDRSGQGWHFNLQSLVTKKQLSVLGVIIGLILHAADVPRPEAVGTFFRMMVYVRPWIVLVPVGYQMDFGNAKLYYKRTLSMIPLRYVLVPGVIYCLARMLYADPVVLGSILIAAAAPVAINAVITNTLYDLNVDLTVASFITTTVSYIVLFIPAMYILVHSFGVLI